MTEHAFPFFNDAILETGASLANADGSYAEAYLYNLLRAQLPPEWSFIWGVQLGAHEYDFLILVPGEGIVNVECKGHGYTFVGATNKFSFYNHETRRTETKDLIGQASKAQRYYINYLKDALFGRSWGLMGRCVVFPIDNHQGINLRGIPVYRAEDCKVENMGLVRIIEESLADARAKLIEFGVQHPAKLTMTDAQRIWRFWTQEEDREVHKFAFVKPNLDAYRRGMESLLTYQQMTVLKGIMSARNRYVLVEGGAGTGKTFLAIALLSTVEGRCLYVCFNKVLAQYVALTTPDNALITISHFHVLDEKLLAKNVKPRMIEGETEKEYWQRVDNLFVAEARRLISGTYQLFDAIVVDEAQDLTDVQLRFLMRFCKNAGKVYLFSDNGQVLYPNRLTKVSLEGLLGSVDDYELSVNLRNPKPVFAYCKDQLGDEGVTSALLDGPEISFVTIHYEGINKFLNQEIVSRFNPRDIAVISPYKDLLLSVSASSGLTFCGPGDNLNKTRKNLQKWKSNECAWKGTTYSFKGLEAMAVVHLLPEGYEEKNLIYVGGSRATYQLYVVYVHDFVKTRDEGLSVQ